MKVKLISHTPDAADLLIFTKGTRLSVAAARMDDVRAMTNEQKLAELEYMAGTIPSSWEFVDYVFVVEGVSRAYTHQQVRTRAGSYAQQSMRVTDMAEFDYVMSGKMQHALVNNNVIRSHFRFAIEAIRAAYTAMRAEGLPTEDARGILPTNIATNIVCKFNLRTMAELARSRTGGRTQGEYIDVVNGMIDAVLFVHPWAEKFFAPLGRDYFADIEAWAEKEFGGDLLKKGELLKIVDRMRKSV